MQEVNLKNIIVVVLGLVLMSTLLLADEAAPSNWVGSGSTYHEELLPMRHYSNDVINSCGPKCGVSIGRYYRIKKGYTNLPGTCSIGDECYQEMFEALTWWMGTDGSGETEYGSFGPGFVWMARWDGGYWNFQYSLDTSVSSSDFDDIVRAIDSGWPVALGGNFWGINATSGDPQGLWPHSEDHYVAIRGYSYVEQYLEPGHFVILDRTVFCTDSWSKADTLELGWDAIANKGGFETITIMD